MFIGKPERVQGILYDIENFIGLKQFSLALFIGGCILIGVDTIRVVVKKKKEQSLANFFILLFFIAAAVYSIQNDIFYNEKVIPTKVNHRTLLIATKGKIVNFNLDENKTAWEYANDFDSLSGNRNSFVVSEQHIYMPFESGSLINLDVNTGQIVWKQQIYGDNNENLFITQNFDEIEESIKELRPLFMSKPLVDKQQVVIASHGQPSKTIPFLYSFDKKLGN